MSMVAYSLLEATRILRVEVAGLQLIIFLCEVSLFDVEGPGRHSGRLLGHVWSRVQGDWVGEGARGAGDIYAKQLGSAAVVKFRPDGKLRRRAALPCVTHLGTRHQPEPSLVVGSLLVFS